MEFVETEQAHGCQHQDPIPGAKIASICRREELEDHGAAPPQSHRLIVERTEAQPLIDYAMRHEKKCGEEDQERNEVRKHARRRANQQPRSECAADDTGYAESKEDGGTIFEFLSITE